MTRRLIALQYILVGCREYFVGDVLPDTDQALADTWVASGAARWVDAEPEARTIAIPAAAVPGMPGLAVGGEATGNELVGKVPDTPQRRRSKRKA